MRELHCEDRIGLAFEGLSREGTVRHVFTTRDRKGGGNLSLSGNRDRKAAVTERAFWSSQLNLSPCDWVVGSQVHGAQIAVVDDEHRGSGATDPTSAIHSTDGLITQKPGLPLYVAAADCAAVIIYAPGPKPTLGVFHAGWRGLAAEILSQGVTQIAELSGGSPSSFLAGIGPCIGLTHFEVGDEVSSAAPVSRTVHFGTKAHVDLAGWAHDQLQNAGLQLGQIEASGLDTAELPRLFFSHRRDGEDAGRMGLIAALEA
ncbi:MAG: polyphenol oxidase family protein [Planctomycetes bacterium]|nr:polyphenol oxidase family protein [Planctomycetota bacterium]